MALLTKMSQSAVWFSQTGVSSATVWTLLDCHTLL